MRLAFALFKYFPYGGLQRDCLKIAREAQRRGHQVQLFALEAQGELPADVPLTCLPVSARVNYRRYEQFAVALQQRLRQESCDVLVGFNRMPGLDFYFAADPCFALRLRTRPFWYGWLPRSRSFLRAERAVYGRDSLTRILALSAFEQPALRQLYGTAAERFYLLPPGVASDRLAPPDYDQRRAGFRRQLGLGPQQKLLLMVGSGFRIKGVDRALTALAALPQPLRQRCQLRILGRDNQRPFERLARQLGLAEQVQFLGGRDDVADFMFAADLLLHPAHREAAGMVLVEAIAARLPVLVTDSCGYSQHIADSAAGLVHRSPFDGRRFARELEQMLTSDPAIWQTAATAYLARTDLVGLAARAVDLIEQEARC